MKALSWRLVGVLIVMAIAVIFVLPTVVMYAKGQKEPEMWPHKKINLGLDLQGGLHLVLEVQGDKGIEKLMDGRIFEIRKSLMQKQIVPKSINRPDNKSVLLVSLDTAEQGAVFEDILKKEFNDLEIQNKTNAGGGMDYTVGMLKREVDRIKKSSVDQALETIRNRIDQLGVAEPVIMKQGENRILVQLPGIKDIKQAKELIGKTAILEFRLIDDEHSIDSNHPESEVLNEIKKDPVSGAIIEQIPLLVKKEVLMTGSAITDARITFDSNTSACNVAIDFNSEGKRKFAAITEKNIQKRLAIILDNTIYSAPTIQSRIPDGHARITGNFSQEEAKILAVALRSGSLLAPVTFLEERTVGPSLGMDSIHKGLMSMAVGTAAIFLFMIIYYKTSGLIADLALLFNVILMLAGLSIIGATLTLPGIAGFILTIGMAVDSNVLIYERMREELRLGQSPSAAVAAGFEKAARTILDSNVTTMVSSIVLYQFGTGPVKGFAVTLILGIIGSLFTSLIVSRLMFDYMIQKLNVKKLSI